jgi:hypothetical protein
MAVKTLGQFEKNVGASFSYVKKDMLMINDALSDIHDKMQHLSMNHAALLEAIANINKPKTAATKKSVKKDKYGKNEELSFYDVKAKKKFLSREYKLVTKSGRRFAVAISPEGTESYRILGSTKAAKKKTIKTKTTKKVSNKKSNTKKPVPKKVVTETETVVY